jgi:prepilin-type N-terminal cleavage/methylation domain-containing protein
MKNFKKGFTLIELLVVIAIMGVLSGFIIVRMNETANAAKDSKRKADIEVIKNALVSYRSENYSNVPVEDCAIGECVALPTALESFLASIPNDPNSGSSYRYISNGVGCTLYATLSNGSVYQYRCDTNQISNVFPVDGFCGASNGSNLNSIPIIDFCALGIATTVSGSGPWAWSCVGLNTGATVDCVANNIVNGSCGTSNGSNLNSIPSTNLCALGTATAVSGSGPWSWTCAGANTGLTDSCSANKIINGSCGLSNGSNLNSIPTTNLCNAGNSSAVSGAGPWTWTCAGANTGSTDSCSANKIINGSCGSSNGQNLSSTPSANLCTLGTASSVGSSSTDFSWTCTGLYTGTTASCSANLIINGYCGSSNGGVFNSIPTTNLCNAGTSSAVSGSGPWTWNCYGLNTGSTASCSAIKKYLCGNTNNGISLCTGTVVLLSGESYVCQYGGASCPTGWTQYNNYTTTSSTSVATRPASECNKPVCNSDTGATTGQHTTLSSTPVESATGRQQYACGPCNDNDHYNYTIYATVTSVGCCPN